MSVAGRRPRELSYGQLRRALIARALTARARILLLDEPLTGLDPRQRTAMKRLLEPLMRKQLTVVIAVHHAEDLPRGMTHGLRLHKRRAYPTDLLFCDLSRRQPAAPWARLRQSFSASGSRIMSRIFRCALGVAVLAFAGCQSSGYAVRPVSRIAADSVGKPVSRLEDAFGQPRKIETTPTKQIYVWFFAETPAGAPVGFHGCEMEVTVDAHSEQRARLFAVEHRLVQMRGSAAQDPRGGALEHSAAAGAPRPMRRAESC